MICQSTCMANYYRKQSPGVRSGRVQKKNRHELTPDYWSHKQPNPVIDKEKPGPGFKHFLKKRDINRFIEILPHWEYTSARLRGIILAREEDDCDGWYHYRGVIAICAWPREGWIEADESWYEEHKVLFERLEVDCEKQENGWVLCKFNPAQIRAFQLLHIFLHELGHHHDRITTRSRRRPGRGERYAEKYATVYETVIWDSYLEAFGVPAWDGKKQNDR